MSEQLDDPNELDEALEVGLGRRAPFSQLGDWVLFSGASSDARTLYWGLSAHLNTSVRDDMEVWPGLLSLARILGLKKPENVSKYMLELEVIGAVEVVRTMIGLVRRNRYVVHQTPPASHTGVQSTSEWYALQHGEKGESAAARKEREAQFDGWLSAIRAGLKAHCDAVAKERAAAKKAKAPFPSFALYSAPALPDFRTPAGGGTARPAMTQKPAGRAVPPRQGVRTPSSGGPVPPLEGVERDQYQLDQSLSPSSSVTPASAPGADAGTEPTRETATPEDNPTPAAAAAVPKARGDETGAQRTAEAVAMLVGLPGEVHQRDALDLVPLVDDALAAGWTLPQLRSHLCRKCDPNRVRYAPAVYRKHLERLPAPSDAVSSHPAAAAPECNKCQGSGLAEDPVTFLPIGPCECRKTRALTAAS